MDVPLWRRLIRGGAVPGASTAMSKIDWAAKPTHLNGVPRRLVIVTLGSLAKFLANVLNTIQVDNAQALLQLVTSRPKGTPLITVSNHTSTLDDPLMWAHRGFPITDAKLQRWILAADDICFTNVVFSYFFRLGKCIPIHRGGGIYQHYMNEALDRINEGEWMHTFPEGKVCQDYGPMRRFKWGVGSLIARASLSPIVLPIAHSGFEKIMPEKYIFGRRPLLPLSGKKVKIVVGQPMQFDVSQLARAAVEFGASGASPFPLGSNTFRIERSARRPLPDHLAALDDHSLGWLYSHITHQTQVEVERLRRLATEQDEKNSKT